MEGVFMNPRHHGNQQTTGITPAGLSIKEMYWKDVGEHIEFPRGFEKHTQKISRNHRTLVGQEHSENHAIVPLLSMQPLWLALDTEHGHWYPGSGSPPGYGPGHCLFPPRSTLC